MTHIYAFSIRGKTLLFSGIIPEGKYQDVEIIANEIVGNMQVDEYVLRLVEEVSSRLKINLAYCPIEYVFRIRRNGGYRVD